MFITNIESITYKPYRNFQCYVCDYRIAEILEKNGFSLMGRRDKSYYFAKTKALIDFLKKNGGDFNGQNL